MPPKLDMRGIFQNLIIPGEINAILDVSYFRFSIDVFQ